MKLRAHLFLWLYVGAILYLSLFPWDFQFYARGGELFWAPLDGRRQILDAVLNVLFYMPLGAAAVLAFGRRWWGAALALALGAGLSYGVESLQMWTPSRVGTLTDLCTNSLGTGLGVGGMWLALGSPGLGRMLRSVEAWRLAPQQALMLGIWSLWHAFPFIPSIALQRWRQLVEVAWDWSDFGEVAVGTWVLREVLPGSKWMWVALALLPAQAFLVDRHFSHASLLGAGLGAGAGLLGARLGARLHQGLLAWLVYQEFRPFTVGPGREFVWEPFRSWFEYTQGNYYGVFFGKLYLYTAVVWALRKMGRMSWSWAVGIPALILAAGEWAQQYLEGRTPESTDVIVLLGGAVLLWLMGEKEQAQS